jgi:hypothetical protein
MMTFLSSIEGVSGPGAAAMPPAPGTQLSLLAFELPTFITPAVAGLTVGAVVGVLGFIAVLMIFGRGNRRPSRRARLAADQVVFIPPYAAHAQYAGMQRETPLPSQAFATPGRSSAPAPAFVPRFVPFDPKFVPSSELSARVFAKMGYAADEADDHRDPHGFLELEMHEEVVVPSRVRGHGTPLMGTPAVTVSPVVVLTQTPTEEKSAPHPLGIISSASSAMRAAPIADLSFDDGPTEIGEPYFDEPPQPRRRTDPPKIRPVVPAGPRFPEHP